MTDRRDPFDFGPPSGGAPPPGASADFLQPPAFPTGGAMSGQDHQFARSWEPAPFAGDSAVGGPPFAWLVVALALAAVAAAAVLVYGATPEVAFGSWAAAGPLAIGLLAVYALLDTRQRARPVYAAPSWTAGLYWAVVVVAGAGIGLSSWRIAEWAGRL